MKKIIIAIVVLVLVVVAGFFYISYENENNLKNFADSLPVRENIMSNKISQEEVALHNQASDCWMIIDKDVLDVTSFVDKHPGGDVIVDGCGKDATQYFTGVREHVKPIVKLLYQKMVIGVLE